VTFTAALLLARRYRSSEAGWGEALREVVTGRSTVLLVAGLVIGLGTGACGYASVEPFFGGIFSGLLTLFLLGRGVVAGRRLRDLRQAGLGLVAFGVLMPGRSGSAGVLTGQAVGLSVGGAAVLGSGSSSGTSSRTTRWWPSCTPWRAAREEVPRPSPTFVSEAARWPWPGR